MANRLVNEFSKKFIDSQNDKVLLDDFLKKYEKLAFNFNKENNNKGRSLLFMKLKELQKILI